MLPPHLAHHFPADVRGRGDSYFATRRVRIARGDAKALTAHVRGTIAYAVQFTAEPGLLTGACSCPYAADNGICKHLWATLKQADAGGLLDPLVRTAGARFEFITLVDGEFAEEMDDTFDEIEDTDGRLTPHRTVPASAWKSMIADARSEVARADAPAPARSPEWPANRRIVYIVDIPASVRTVGLPIELATEKSDGAGGWTPPVQLRIPGDAWLTAPDPADRQIAQMLVGARPNPYQAPAPTAGFVLSGPALDTTLRLMCETGRCRVRIVAGERPATAVRWDDGPAWRVVLRVSHDDAGGYVLTASLRRPDAEIPLAAPAMLHSTGIVLIDGALARLEHSGTFAFVVHLRAVKSMRVDANELPMLLESLFTLSRRPELELPPDAHVSELRVAPQPGVAITTDRSLWRAAQFRLDSFFLYGSVRMTGQEVGSSVFDRDALVVHHRDQVREAEALARLASLGAREEWDYTQSRRRLAIGSKKLEVLVPLLVAEGWRVEADGAVYRSASAQYARVRSGVDWFELQAGARFGDVDVPLHDMLVAQRSGATTIVLSDGSRGVLPLDWLARLGPLAAGGKLADGVLRYRTSQATLLDALLAALPDADVDATFARAREELRGFDRVAPAEPPRTFRGTLRDYQRDGLGWLHFLRRFELGGCLADDMGLGKTVQVLALLDSRRGTPARPKPPSIVVVPRSLVFNWMRERQRFTPRLRVLNHSGVERRAEVLDNGTVDVVLTTYGTLRRDAAQLARIEFDYAILDEAQSIKTATSVTAKAARLLRARHRLAMTGTPIENRIEELWSLFEFLNPGMLGASSSFAALARLTDAESGSGTGREVLARALRPVILRRTKAQVAPELPERAEQTLLVELEGAQRTFYDDLLARYRESVMSRIERVGLGRSKMHVLEALLRLRQAACHPALADPRKSGAPSAKLDALIPALGEVVAEGHKALVFSQFTTFLTLVRERLDSADVRYEYLDGRVRDRASRVDHFQSDPACALFLISLKAGGHGLNLTAADYVFILDPWWNPAAEAQAIDRAHRIGQSKRVIATRIVARNTIEEKILELQASKRALADAILGQDQGLLAGIGRAELDLLLG